MANGQVQLITRDDAIEFLQSVALQAVQAQELVRQGALSAAADLLDDIRRDAQRAENIIVALEALQEY